MPLGDTINWNRKQHWETQNSNKKGRRSNVIRGYDKVEQKTTLENKEFE